LGSATQLVFGQDKDGGVFSLLFTHHPKPPKLIPSLFTLSSQLCGKLYIAKTRLRGMMADEKYLEVEDV